MVSCGRFIRHLSHSTRVITLLCQVFDILQLHTTPRRTWRSRKDYILHTHIFTGAVASLVRDYGLDVVRTVLHSRPVGPDIVAVRAWHHGHTVRCPRFLPRILQFTVTPGAAVWVVDGETAHTADPERPQAVQRRLEVVQHNGIGKAFEDKAELPERVYPDR